MRTRVLALVALTLTLSFAACAREADQSGGTSNPGGVSNPDAPANGPDGFEGSLATSGLYSAGWTASPDAPADVFNSVSPVTLASDRQTFGHLTVNPDGSINFGSAASGLSSNGAYNGSGAKVTVDKSGKFVCAFTVDTDLTGTTDGALLHLKGGMTAHWHPEGIGDLSCP
jgi:hypothetical protein